VPRLASPPNCSARPAASFSRSFRLAPNPTANELPPPPHIINRAFVNCPSYRLLPTQRLSTCAPRVCQLPELPPPHHIINCAFVNCPSYRLLPTLSTARLSTGLVPNRHAANCPRTVLGLSSDEFACVIIERSHVRAPDCNQQKTGPQFLKDTGPRASRRTRGALTSRACRLTSKILGTQDDAVSLFQPADSPRASLQTISASPLGLSTAPPVRLRPQLQKDTGGASAEHADFPLVRGHGCAPASPASQLHALTPGSSLLPPPLFVVPLYFMYLAPFRLLASSRSFFPLFRSPLLVLVCARSLLLDLLSPAFFALSLALSLIPLFRLHHGLPRRDAAPYRAPQRHVLLHLFRLPHRRIWRAGQRDSPHLRPRRARTRTRP